MTDLRQRIIDVLAGPPYREFAFEDRADRILAVITKDAGEWLQHIPAALTREDLVDMYHGANIRATVAQGAAKKLEGELIEALADAVGWHGIFASVAAHLGVQERGTTTGNEHVIARAKFASECITALWQIAGHSNPEAALDPAGFAERVIHPPVAP